MAAEKTLIRLPRDAPFPHKPFHGIVGPLAYDLDKSRIARAVPADQHVLRHALYAVFDALFFWK